MNRATLSPSPTLHFITPPPPHPGPFTRRIWAGEVGGPWGWGSVPRCHGQTVVASPSRSDRTGTSRRPRVAWLRGIRDASAPCEPGRRRTQAVRAPFAGARAVGGFGPWPSRPPPERDAIARTRCRASGRPGTRRERCGRPRRGRLRLMPGAADATGAGHRAGPAAPAWWSAARTASRGATRARRGGPFRASGVGPRLGSVCSRDGSARPRTAPTPRRSPPPLSRARGTVRSGGPREGAGAGPNGLIAGKPA